MAAEDKNKKTKTKILEIRRVFLFLFCLGFYRMKLTTFFRLTPSGSLKFRQNFWPKNEKKKKCCRSKLHKVGKFHFTSDVIFWWLFFHTDIPPAVKFKLVSVVSKIPQNAFALEFQPKVGYFLHHVGPQGHIRAKYTSSNHLWKSDPPFMTRYLTLVRGMRKNEVEWTGKADIRKVEVLAMG